MNNKQQDTKIKTQHTLRIYSQDDLNTLQSSYDLTREGFKDQSEFIRYCVVLGAEKLMGDKKIDQRLNLDEIKELLKQINTKLENIGGNMQVNESERKVDALFIQRFCNYIAKILFENYDNASGELLDGLFYLKGEKLDIMKELDGKSKQSS
ncbi:MAG: hypothetical protein E7062_10475 [Spirochaetaceae bacterium]|nr:hypothetical protein [Spirochaetaceae bacterium]